MTSRLKSTLWEVLDNWLEQQDAHPDRPPGLACPHLADMMTDAAEAVYEASHQGAEMSRIEAEESAR